jgi:hypothetical protein
MQSGFIERRMSERLAVRTPAKILLPHSDAPIDCVASNVSDGGAMIHVRGAELPEVFVLRFNDSGRQRHCRLVWRKGAEFGIAFTDRTQVNFGRRIANR